MLKNFQPGVQKQLKQSLSKLAQRANRFARLHAELRLATAKASILQPRSFILRRSAQTEQYSHFRKRTNVTGGISG